MKSIRSRYDDDLGVRISLAIAVGMLIGAIVVVCIWNAMSETTEAAIFIDTDEMP